MTVPFGLVLSDVDAQVPLSVPRQAPITLLPLRIETRFIKVIKDAAAALILAAMQGEQPSLRTATSAPSTDARLAAAAALARAAAAQREAWIAEIAANEAPLRVSLLEQAEAYGRDLSLLRRGQRRLRGRLTALANQREAHADDEPRLAERSRWTQGREAKARQVVEAMGRAVDLVGLSDGDPAEAVKARQDALSDALNGWVDLLRRVPNQHNPELKPFARAQQLLEKAEASAERLQALIDQRATLQGWAERAAAVKDMGRYLRRYRDRVRAAAPESLARREQLEALVAQEDERAQRRGALVAVLEAQLQQALAEQTREDARLALDTTLRLAASVCSGERVDVRLDTTEVEAAIAEAEASVERLTEGSQGTLDGASLRSEALRTESMSADPSADGLDLNSNHWDNELWIRVYPDTIAIDRLETRLTEDEQRDGQSFWIRCWFAFGDRAQRLAAWRGLVARHGTRRATWISRATRPLEPLPGPIGGDEAGLDPSYEVWASRLWSGMIRGYADPRLWATGWGALVQAVGEDHARAAMRRAMPADLGEQMLQAWRSARRAQSAESTAIDLNANVMTRTETRRVESRTSEVLRLDSGSAETLEVSLSDTRRLTTLSPASTVEETPPPPPDDPPPPPALPPKFPALLTRAPGEQAPATAPLMPERLVFRVKPNARTETGETYRDYWGRSYTADDDSYFDVLGEPIPQPLVMGPDLSKPLLDADGALSADADMRWMVDFEEAVAKGMAARVQLGYLPAQWRGVGGVQVMGVREAKAGDALGELLAHQACSGRGAELLPQGTPTNNTGEQDSGVRLGELPPEESFDAEHEGPLFTPSADPLRRRDGERLATALGVAPERLQNFRHADGIDISAASIANRALYPGTLGRWLEQGLYAERHSDPALLQTEDLDRLRRLFVDHVRGRGGAPALRVGRQPYGVLPMTRLRDSWLGRAPADREENAQEVLHRILRRLGWRWDWDVSQIKTPHQYLNASDLPEPWFAQLVRMDRRSLADPLSEDAIRQELPWYERGSALNGAPGPERIARAAQHRFLRLLGQRAVSPELHHRYGLAVGRDLRNSWSAFVDELERLTGKDWDALLKFYGRDPLQLGRLLRDLAPESLPGSHLESSYGSTHRVVPVPEDTALGDLRWLRSTAAVGELVGPTEPLRALLETLPSQWLATPPAEGARPLELLLRGALTEATWDAVARAWEDRAHFDARVSHHVQGRSGKELAADWAAVEAQGLDLATLFEALRESWELHHGGSLPHGATPVTEGPEHWIARFAIDWGAVERAFGINDLDNRERSGDDIRLRSSRCALLGVAPDVGFIGATDPRGGLPQGLDLASDLAEVRAQGLDLLDLVEAYRQSWLKHHAGGSFTLGAAHRVARYAIDWEAVIDAHPAGIDGSPQWMKDGFCHHNTWADLPTYAVDDYLIGPWFGSPLSGVTHHDLMRAREAILDHKQHGWWKPWTHPGQPTDPIYQIADAGYAWARALDDYAHMGPLHPLCERWHTSGWASALPQLFGADPEPFLVGRFRRSRWKSFITEMPRGAAEGYVLNDAWAWRPLDALSRFSASGGFQSQASAVFDSLQEHARFATRRDLMLASARDIDLASTDHAAADLCYASARQGPQLGRLELLSETIEAARLLVELPQEAADLALREHLDLVSHRLDAWLLGLVQQRLEAQRAASPGTYVGAYGFVEDLDHGATRLDDDGDELIHSFEHPQLNRPATDPDNQGFILAPSLNQAMTGAVLRAACQGRSGSAARINLSSARAQAALRLIEGVRQGQRLAALLGYGFERRLHVLDPALNRFTRPLRQAFPLEDDEGVVDGLTLARRVRAGARFPLGQSLSYSPQEKADADAALDHLADLLDAVGDLLLAEAMHQALQGRYERAGAALKVLSEGAPPPQEFEVLRTPRRSRSLEHRVALVRVAAQAPAEAWGRAAAEPTLEAWAAEQLPPLAQLRAVVDWTDAPRPQSSEAVVMEGSGLDDRLAEGWRGRRLSVSAAELGLGALDLIQLLGGQPMAEDGALAKRLLLAAKAQLMAEATMPMTDAREWTPPAPPTLALHLSARDEGWGEEVLSFAELQPLAESLHQLLAQARPLSAGDLRRNTDVVDLTENERARWDLAELGRRAQALMLSFFALCDQVEQPHDALPVQLYARLAAFNLPALIPWALNPFDPWNHGTHKELRAAARPLLQARRAEVEAAADAARDASTPHARAEALQALGRALMGRDFTLLPTFTLADPAEATLALQHASGLAPGPLDMERWLHGVALVREPLRSLEAARMYGELVVGPAPELQPLQLPPAPGEPWLGLEFDPAQVNLGEERLSLVLDLPDSFDPHARLAGLRLDAWVEALPEPQVSAGLAFHYDQPNAEAPQAVLVAVHSRPEGEPQSDGTLSTTWGFEELFGVLDATRFMMRLRAVEPDQVQPWQSVYGSGAWQVHPFFQGFPATLDEVPCGDLGTDFGLSTGITALDPS